MYLNSILTPKKKKEKILNKKIKAVAPTFKIALIFIFFTFGLL